MDIHDGANVRNLELIQETGPYASNTPSRASTFVLIVACGACILFAILALGLRHSSTTNSIRKADPLGELAVRPTPSTILPGEVTFPVILSDRANPATALAALPGPPSASTPGSPPPASDRLSVVPLPPVPIPARDVLVPNGALARPKDKLSELAAEASDRVTGGATLESTGSEGGWQVQVSSFRTTAEADAFANQLRARGHRAHVQRAEIASRGIWYRVKIGPFANQNEAFRYRNGFEAKERMPALVVKSGVDPH